MKKETLSHRSSCACARSDQVPSFSAHRIRGYVDCIDKQMSELDDADVPADQGIYCSYTVSFSSWGLAPSKTIADGISIFIYRR